MSVVSDTVESFVSASEYRVEYPFTMTVTFSDAVRSVYSSDQRTEPAPSHESEIDESEVDTGNDLMLDCPDESEPNEVHDTVAEDAETFRGESPTRTTSLTALITLPPRE